MEIISQSRKVLFLKADHSIGKIFTLMKQMEQENTVKGSGKNTLGSIQRKQCDAVIVDLRFQHQQCKDELHGIGAIRPSLIGKMLTVTLEVNGPKSSALIERYLVHRLPLPLIWLVRHR